MAFEQLYEDCNLSEDLLSEGSVTTEKVRSSVGLTQMSNSPLSLKKSSDLFFDKVVDCIRSKSPANATPSFNADKECEQRKEMFLSPNMINDDHLNSYTQSIERSKAKYGCKRYCSEGQRSLKQEISSILKFLVEAKVVEQQSIERSNKRRSKLKSVKVRNIEMDDFVTMKQIEAICDI